MATSRTAVLAAAGGERAIARAVEVDDDESLPVKRTCPRRSRRGGGLPRVDALREERLEAREDRSPA